MSVRGALFEDNGLGDTVCTRWEARAAAQAVTAMNSFFVQLGRPAQFAPLVKSVNDEWAATEGFFNDWTLCSAKSAGQHAELATRQMAEYSNVAPPAPQPLLAPGPTDKINAIIELAALATVVVGGLEVYRAVVGPKKKDES